MLTSWCAASSRLVGPARDLREGAQRRNTRRHVFLFFPNAWLREEQGFETSYREAADCGIGRHGRGAAATPPGRSPVGRDAACASWRRPARLQCGNSASGFAGPSGQELRCWFRLGIGANLERPSECRRRVSRSASRREFRLREIVAGSGGSTMSRALSQLLGSVPTAARSRMSRSGARRRRPLPAP